MAHLAEHRDGSGGIRRRDDRAEHDGDGPGHANRWLGTRDESREAFTTTACPEYRSALLESMAIGVRRVQASVNDWWNAMLRAVLFGIGLAVVIAGTNRAAEPDLRNQVRHQGARNELGLLIYCQDQGLADQAAVAAQKRSIELLPPATLASVGEQEEADGRLGYLAFDGRQGLFTASASAQGISIATACAMRSSLALSRR